LSEAAQVIREALELAGVEKRALSARTRSSLALPRNQQGAGGYD
jgi:hypothetical protein